MTDADTRPTVTAPPKFKVKRGLRQGLRGAPWWAHWVSGLFSQGAIGWAQYLFHVGNLGIWPHIAGLAATAIVGVAMAYGPGNAGRLAQDVGGAVRRARWEGKDSDG